MIRPLVFAAILVSLGCGIAYAEADLGARIAGAKREAAQAAADAKRFEAEADAARDAAGRARAQSDALAARIAAAEARITLAEADFAVLGRAFAASRFALAQKQEPLAHLAATLTHLARRPPVLALAAPGSLRETARTRTVLAAALPAVRARTAALRAQIASDQKLRREAALVIQERMHARADLDRQKAALAALEAQEMARAGNLGRAALTASDTALSMDEAVRTLSSGSARAAFEAGAARSLATIPGPGMPPSRTLPRPARPVYRLPVAGTLVAGMGELSASGIHSRGLTLEVAPDQAAVAPSGGRILYAGGFRSYGEIVIIDHGGGWTSLVTGLATLGVRVGDRVTMGQEVGRTGARPVTVELRREGAPFPIAQLVALG
ncbi:MAG TPA: peptidoglycan DD-metalloendopeptidase family protein [Allosphingosinicella sp.]